MKFQIEFSKLQESVFLRKGGPGQYKALYAVGLVKRSKNWTCATVHIRCGELGGNVVLVTTRHKSCILKTVKIITGLSAAFKTNLFHTPINGSPLMRKIERVLKENKNN